MSLTLNLYDQPIYNGGDETIPAFAVVELKAPGFRKHKGKEWFNVAKPTADGAVYFVNGPFAVKAGKTGGAAELSRSPGVHVLCDKGAGAEPATNEQWGPVKDNWAVTKDGAGFTIIGDLKGQAASAPGQPPRASTRRVRVKSPGGGGAEIYGLLVKTVPAATYAYNDSEPITPGYETDAVKVMVWNAERTKLRTKMVPGAEGQPEQPEFYGCVNLWPSALRGSTTEPVLLLGRLIKFGSSDPLPAFLPTNVADLRGLAGYDKSAAQAVRHLAASERFGLGGVTCPPA